MNPTKTALSLIEYNRWRRGKSTKKQSPSEIGKTIDEAVLMLSSGELLCNGFVTAGGIEVIKDNVTCYKHSDPECIIELVIINNKLKVFIG